MHSVSHKPNLMHLGISYTGNRKKTIFDSTTLVLMARIIPCWIQKPDYGDKLQGESKKVDPLRLLTIFSLGLSLFA